MILARAKRKNSSYCRVCGKVFAKGEMYIKLHGTHRVMRSKMCMDHLRYKDCKICEHRLKCLTNTKKTVCVLGGEKVTYVEEL